jgi:hypothetical protein
MVSLLACLGMSRIRICRIDGVKRLAGGAQ